MTKKLKNVQVVQEDVYGVCLWRMPDGTYLGDDEGRFLSVYGYIDDPVLEGKMRVAAISYLGAEGALGDPIWLPGSRQVTDSEADDHMERLLDGKIPDIVDQTKQLLGRTNK